ncbi:SchA/CurD-like domain-containing protein [Streptomyces sp. NPDC059063]|uniref:SchA/CurD-like domain-containing protein n=1 Tax=unclassified Streptomyces TaxID=2593676 RepID=UPI00369D2EFA
MAFIAISYKVRTGHEDDIAEIFSERNFKRADSAEYRDEQGRAAGRNVSTGLFIEGEFMTRVVQFEGDLRQIGPHMGAQEGVKEAERRLSPYLQVPRDTQTVAGFREYFQNALMQCVFQEARAERSAQLAAWVYRVKAGHDDEIGEVFEKVQGAVFEGTGAEQGPLLASAAFVKDAYLVWAVQYEGELGDVVGHLTSSGIARQTEEGLLPYLADARPAATPEEFGAATMRRLQMLSAEVP